MLGGLFFYILLAAVDGQYLEPCPADYILAGIHQHSDVFCALANLLIFVDGQ